VRVYVRVDMCFVRVCVCESVCVCMHVCVCVCAYAYTLYYTRGVRKSKHAYASDRLLI